MARDEQVKAAQDAFSAAVDKMKYARMLLNDRKTKPCECCGIALRDDNREFQLTIEVDATIEKISGYGTRLAKYREEPTPPKRKAVES